jgi:hypothetical protein
MRALALTLAVLASCSQGTGSMNFGAQPFATVTSAACSARFDAYSAPDPFVRGEGEIEIVATAASAPLDGLDVSVVPFMPAMGHGASLSPVVAAQGNGKYLVTNVVLSMPGEWQLRTQIGGACTDAIVFNLSVQ